ncbi:thioredoxin domain-containing protein [Nocardioides sp.]|uniref:DsbA family protein n=1 Tax=Nocardioides sp. TaxID=35761 RepID=UPI001D5790FB|nr:thioredoxin domain-containing protein [Nocardioides sp.]MBU1800699.1 thioredoxin domain-containing protein [Actinomycetota bacterium]
MSNKPGTPKGAAKVRAKEQRAAELRAEAERRRRAENLKRGAIVGGLLLLVVVAAIFISTRSGEDLVASDVGSSDYGLIVGEAGAPREVVIYEDFLCPICGVLEEGAGEGLAAAAAAGTVVVDYRPIAILNRFGPYSADSVNAFLVVQQEAGDEVAKEFHDLLFADQPAEEGPFPDTDWLVEKAVEAGADEAAVRPGIEDGSRMDDVEAATQEAEDAGVQGTPTVVLDGVAFRDGKSWEEIADNLVEEVS